MEFSALVVFNSTGSGTSENLIVCTIALCTPLNISITVDSHMHCRCALQQGYKMHKIAQRAGCIIVLNLVPHNVNVVDTKDDQDN